MAKTIRLSVLFVVSFVICGIGFFNIVQANTAVPSGSITATYNPVTKELIANGSFKDGQTSPSGDVRNGFALFINGATPLVEGSALDPIINLVPAPTTPTGVWSYFRTLITTPSKICVTMYDVQMSKLGHTGGHSDNPDGPDRNGGNQNSFDQNNQSFSFQVIDGKLDLNKDGSAGNADDGTLLGKTIIDGKVDINGSGTINSADDGAFNGKAVIDGEIDMNGSGTITNADDGSFADDPSTCVVPTIICTDNDNDGYFVEGGQCGQIDCNDSNASINPGATEVCNNINDDCDIWTDEGFLWNNKGQSCTSGLGICANSGVYVCDGFNPSGQTICSATPGQAGIETCNNLDDDCDGTTDESLTRATSCGTGVCSQNTGTETCSIGIWGQNTCNPFGGATTETCDGSLDQDCDGQIDEGCACTDGTTQPCGSSNVGACQYGIQTCSGGQWGTCVGSVEPTTETCDGTDNDCDGTVDESLTRATSCGVGACTGNTGYETCSAGTWGQDTCQAFNGASIEICNNLDDDCDGTTDESLTRATSCGTGVCSQNTGTETCSIGIWGQNTCNPFGGATTETCDGSLDQDCDGQIDEGCACTDGTTQPCGSSNVGACQYGIQTCSGGQWGTCVGSVEPTTETCDGTDNDCDGTTDEGYNLGIICSVGIGSCERTGAYVCSGGTSVCSATPGQPGAEVCNNADDDCDGTIDEGLTQTTYCGLGVCSQNTGYETCSAGAWGGNTCNPYYGASTEICDGSLDQNCNGTIDEGCACTDGNTQPCGSSNVGACQYGTQTCSGGQWSTCIGSIEPTTETCDGVDNDCDGTTDESLTRATSCGLGACTGNTGYETCSAGTWGQDTCNPLNGATTEICDGIDNNCDGTIDEGITRPTTCGLGICSQNTGNETCVLGIWGGDSCNPYLGAIAEVCSDSLDNDCDGNVDENCQQPQPPSGVFGNFGGGQFVLQYTLNATKTGTGSGTVTATGIDCGSDCSESYNENTMVALTATADSNSDFIGWSGDCSGTVCQVTMSFNRNVSAQFNARGEVAGAATSTEPGEILGESTTCYLYLLEYIKYGANNNPVEVKKLQTFLNENMGTNLPITGIYDKETKKVVEQFQLKYKNEVLKPWVDEGLWSSVDVPTGYVYKTTKRWINLLKCSLLNIPTPDLSEDRYPVMTGQATGGTEGQILGESTTTGTGQTLEQGTTSQEGATTGEENATQITGETKTTSNTWWVVLLAIVGVGFLLLAYWLAKKKKQNITV